MARKQKQQPEEMEPTPSADDAETVQIENAAEGADASREWAWPESRTHASMFVDFNDHDRSTIALDMGEKVLKAEALKAQKKAVSQRLQGEIDELTNAIEAMAVQLERGGEERPFECEWVFERRMVQNADGWELVEDLTQKTLRRLDTGVPVRSAPITDEERQATLALEPDGDSPAGGDDIGDAPETEDSAEGEEAE